MEKESTWIFILAISNSMFSFIDKWTLSVLLVGEWVSERTNEWMFASVCATFIYRRKLWLLCYDSIIAVAKKKKKHTHNQHLSTSNKLQFDLFERQQKNRSEGKRAEKRRKKTIDFTSPELNELVLYVRIIRAERNGMELKWNEVSCWMHAVATQLIAAKSIFQYVCMDVCILELEQIHTQTYPYTVWKAYRNLRYDFYIIFLLVGTFLLYELKSGFVCSRNQFESLTFLSFKCEWMNIWNGYETGYNIVNNLCISISEFFFKLTSLYPIPIPYSIFMFTSQKSHLALLFLLYLPSLARYPFLIFFRNRSRSGPFRLARKWNFCTGIGKRGYFFPWRGVCVCVGGFQQIDKLVTSHSLFCVFHYFCFRVFLLLFLFSTSRVVLCFLLGLQLMLLLLLFVYV